MLLSGLVLPGLGQIANGAFLKGLAFGGGTLAAVVLLVQRVARETFLRLPTDPMDIDLATPLRIAREIERDNASFLFWLTLAFVALWVGSILDAWRDARRG